MDKEVSLYVPCFNAAGYVRSCLESVFSQTYPIREVLVIDDGSVDNTLQSVSDFKVEPIRYETNLGITVVRNAALSMVSGEFVAGVDSDVVLEREWLERIMPHFFQCHGGRCRGKNRGDEPGDPGGQMEPCSKKS